MKQPESVNAATPVSGSVAALKASIAAIHYHSARGGNDISSLLARLAAIRDECNFCVPIPAPFDAAHGCASLHCLCCYRSLKEAPTDLGWIKHSRTEGICFDCIESLHRTMVALRETEARHRKSHARPEQRKTMKSKTNIRTATALAVACSVLLGLCSCSNRPIQAETPLPDAAFVVESGPDEIGWSRMWVVRHKETGQRFVFTERASGGILLAPLKP